jgi:DNA-binding transcriptional ArsR family regulator
MDSQTPPRLAYRVNVFKALAHPTRLFMVEELAKGKQCVGELTALVKADPSTVSKHLALLKAAGILRDEKQGSQVYYELAMPCVLTFFGCIDTVVAERAEWQLLWSEK